MDPAWQRYTHSPAAEQDTLALGPGSAQGVQLAPQWSIDVSLTQAAPHAW